MGDDIEVSFSDLQENPRLVHLCNAEWIVRQLERNQRLEALVSWIDGRCVDASGMDDADLLATGIRAAINRYREEGKA